MTTIVSIQALTKTYDSGFQALKGVSFDIQRGEILALLGPNGAGKTTLISCVCGIATPTSGEIRVGGHDVVSGFRAARALIGLVPQEIALEPFERVIDTVRFSRGLFGKPRNDDYIEELLQKLSLYEKRLSRVQALSGGMKRRVMIAKALSHEPEVLFLDEPTAGVDVDLRKDMWNMVQELKNAGVTIILTTHYIEEAEAMADRVGVISKGELLVIEEKAALMASLAQKELRIELAEPLEHIPESLARFDVQRSDDGRTLHYSYRTTDSSPDIAGLLQSLADAGGHVVDLHTEQSSLEDIFVGLVKGKET